MHAQKDIAPWRIAHSECSTGWGGQEHRVLAELAGFQKRGAQVWLLAPERSEIKKRAERSGIAVNTVEFDRSRFLPNVLRLAKWLRNHRIQILNPHSSKDGWVLGIAGRLASTPLIIRTRHIDVDYPNRFVSRHAFTTLCHHILTTSDKISTHFQETFRLSPDRISTIPTGIDIDRFSPEGPKAQLPFDNPRCPVIGMISVLRSWKGHETLVEAAVRLKKAGFQARYIIAGEGAAGEWLPGEISIQGLSEDMFLLGHREDVPELLRTLDLLLIPSTRHEGVPQIGLQALATKTPVVGSDVGGIPEIIRPGETGRIFAGGNSADLADKIREVFSQPARTAEMAEQGRRMVERSHSLDAMLDKISAVYQRYLPS